MSYALICGVKTYQLGETEGEREAECETGIQTGIPVEKSVLGVKGRLVQDREGTGGTYNSRLPLETLSLCRRPSREAGKIFSEKHFKEETIPHSLSRQEGERAGQRPRDAF